MNVTKIKTRTRTKWLILKQAFYKSKNGKDMSWYFVERKNNPAVVTIIVRSLKAQKYLFIEQLRIPIQKRILEFPAGLVDSGETLEQAALRELQEETGYEKVKIHYVSPLSPKSAGLTNECAALVKCTIEDEKAIGKAHMEESEDIMHFWFSPDEFKAYVIKNKDTMVANDVMAFMLQYYDS